MLLAAPAAVWAQYSTFIPPTPKSSDSAAMAATAAAKARAERATAARIANRKAWVDSAAGLPPRPSRGADTLLLPVDTTQVLEATANGQPARPILGPPAPAPRTEPRSEAPKARAGARAPETASKLPLFMLVGLVSFVTGIILLAPSSRTRHHA
jgi:hypothetical protein